MKKSVWYILTVSILIFSCSPKFQEFNDSGFGGGFAIKPTKNNQTTATRNNDSHFTNVLFEDSIVYDESFRNNETQVFTTSLTSLELSSNFNSKFKYNAWKTENQLFSIKNKQQKALIQQNIIPNKRSSFYRWYFFILAVIAFLGTLYGIVDLTGPGAGTLEAILSILLGIAGIISTIVFIYYSLKVDKFIRNRCLLTKIALVLWFFIPISIPLFLIGIIYDYFKNGIKFK